MPVFDWECPECGGILADQYHPLHTARPVCGRCGFLMEKLFTGRHSVFLPVTVDIDGRSITFNSLHDVRRFEQDSEARYKDGRGQPYILRAFTQDGSNYDKNSFGETPFTPFRTRSAAGVPFVTRRPRDS